MKFKSIKNTLNIIKFTPLHPQWLIFRNEKQRTIEICRQLDGIVVDIGCASKTPKQHLPENCHYIGLDYPSTADNWYLTKPDIYGDAQQLPFKHDSIDCILLLDVLEHIPSPDHCIKEIYKALKPGGKLLVRIPFLYPTHDAPLDFQRWTIHGLRRLAEKNNFSIISSAHTGTPVESSAMLTNIALTRTGLKWVDQKNPLALLLIPSLVALIPLINLCGVIFSVCGAKDDFMAFSFTMTWRKKAAEKTYKF